MEERKPKQECSGNIRAQVLFWLALCFSVFQLTVPVFVPLIDLQLKSIHIILGLSTVLLAHSLKTNAKAGAGILIRDWILIGILLAANINIFLNWEPIYADPGEGTVGDWVLGALVILAILEAARRSTGWVMPMIVVFMFIYVFMGPLIPGRWGHPGFSFEFVMESVYYSPLGIYGPITGYSATFIGMFIIFGSLLLFTGGGETFTDLAFLIAGRFIGGPAKAAVVASALFGTISGSPASNVSVTGNYTIPLMKRLGYHPDFAGGVEAMASTGGTITPPIMGIVAFIMAELIDVPYIKIIGYALIPCCLYYIGVFAGVHFEALNLGLVPVPKEEIPDWRSILTWSKLIPFVAPIVILIGMLLRNYSLTESGFYACVTVIVTYVFSTFSLSGIRERIFKTGKALSEGGKTLAMIVPVLVTVGMLVDLLGVTGVALKISGLIIDLGGRYLIGGLLAGAIVPLILGTALPTSASYILSAALIAPALLQLNLDIVAVHMFLVYWAALSAVTPPTCVPAVVAAHIGGGNWLRVAFVGMKLGVVAFFMPFCFILEPALLARGTLEEILGYSISAAAGAVFIASGLFGYLRRRTNIVIRILCVASGALLLYPSHGLYLPGAVIALVAFLGEWVFAKVRRVPVQ